MAEKKTPTKKAAASRSGNPAKKAAAQKAVSRAAQKSPSDVSAFKKRAQGIALPLPSGLVCTAKRVELQTFIRQGNVPNPLMEIVSEALEKGNQANIDQMVGVDEGKVDLAMVNDMYEMVNSVVVASMVQPKVHEVPEKESDRDDDLLYVDEVDDEDKMFIFQWASGGTSDIETFRSEARADMAALAESQGAKSATK